MVATASEVAPGFLGDEQDAAAARAFRPAQIFGRKNLFGRKNPCRCGGLEPSTRPGVNRRAIGPAGKEAILQFPVGVEFVRQKPADHEQNHDKAQRNEGTAAAAVLAIMVRHAKAFVEYFGLTR